MPRKTQTDHSHTPLNSPKSKASLQYTGIFQKIPDSDTFDMMNTPFGADVRMGIENTDELNDRT